MAATTTTGGKTRGLAPFLAALKRHFELHEPEERSVLEELIYAVVRENAPRKDSDRAFANLRERFYDWNEIRVSSAHEVSAALESIPQALAKAQRIVSILQELFETTFAYELESTAKRGLKQAERQMARFQASSDFAVAWVVQRSLEGHAIPVDLPMMQALKRLGVIDDDVDDLRTVQGQLEHQISKARGRAFVDALTDYAHGQRCDQAGCSGCPLKGQATAGGSKSSDGSRSSRPKPR